MKRIITYLTIILFAAGTYAQSSGLLSYQAVIRDIDQALVTNQTVGMQISILSGSVTGTLVYSETQTPTTNINGLVSLEIGSAVGFDTITWANGPYFVKVEIDPTGGTSYSISGTTQLQSVPFSLYAQSAYEVDGDPTNELQNIYLQQDTMIVLTNGGFVVLPAEEDPIFAASVAAGITVIDTASWNSNVPVWSQNGNDAYYDTGNVGIGTSVPGQALTVTGTVESTTGGFMFPDGTVQTTAASANSILPTGLIVPFAGDTSSVPSGWMLCDGTIIDRTTYANLFNVIGQSFGDGDGSTTFNLPDFRGMFLRGVDNGAGRDPDVGSRTAPAQGGNANDNVGSVQFSGTSTPNGIPFLAGANGGHSHGHFMSLNGDHSHTGSADINGNHSHLIPADTMSIREASSTYSSGTRTVFGIGSNLWSYDNGIHGHPLSIQTSGLHNHNLTIDPEDDHIHTISGGDNETRPRNIYVNYIIKY